MGTAGKLNIEQTSGNLLNSLFNSSDDFTKKDAYGKNGTITISTDGENYTTYTSASNEYSFDGTTFNIAKLGNFDSSVEGVDEITVTTEKDTSSIKDTVIKFIDAYNQLLDDVYGEIQTSRPKKNGSYYDLENAINTYGDKVTSFFVDSDKGLAATLNNEIDRAISTRDKKVGYLSGIAGIENTTTEKDNALYSQINNMQTLINNLQTRYENEMERYWKQFTTLETYMSNMQSQSSIFGSDS